MAKKIDNYKVSVIVLAFLIVGLFFGKIIINPNSYFLQWEYDGVSVYYISMFYAQNDSTDWFTGMNYPYGENLFFATGHYSFTKLFEFLNSIGVSSANYIGFLNLFILLLIPFGIFIIYLLLRHYGVNKNVSLIYSLIIGFLSPQIGAMAGYYLLGCVFLFPVFWYISIKYFSSKHYVFWGIVYVVYVMMWMRIYFFIYGSIIFVLFYLFNYLRNRNNITRFNDFKFVLSSFLIVIVPIVFFGIYLSKNVIDVSDRIEVPYGADYFGISLSFLPKYIFDLPQVRAIFNIGPFGWLGSIYFGVFGTLFLLISIAYAIISKFNKRWSLNNIIKIPEHFKTALWVTLVVLIISTNILYHTHIFDLFEFLKPLKQLRGIPRLAYFVYYPLFTLIVIVFYNFYAHLKARKKNLATLFFIAVTIFWGFEAFIKLYATKRYIENQNVVHSASEFLNKKGNYINYLESRNVLPSDFSCILSLPFSVQGSEKITMANHEAFYQSFKASYNLNVPMIGALLNRSSISETANAYQLFSNDYIKKEIVKDFPTSKPLIIIENKTQTLRNRETVLLKKANLFFKNDSINLYSLSIDSLLIEPKDLNFVTQRFDSLSEKNEGDYIYCENRLFMHRTYDNILNENVLIGKGAKHCEQGLLQLIDTVFSEPEHEYTLSFWLYLDKRKYGLPEITIEKQYNEQLESFSIDPLANFDVYKNWLRIEYSFKSFEGMKFNLKLKGEYITIDNLIVANKDTPVYQKVGKMYVYNNYIIN